MRRHGGFTLVEVMTASFLAGMIFLTAMPVILFGKRSIRQMAEREAAAMIGDSVFEEAKEKLMYAKRVCLAYEADEDSADEWRRIGGDFSWEDMEMTLEACAMGPDRLEFAIRLWKNGQCVYERRELIPLLNLVLNGNRMEEGDSASDLWYLSEGGSAE